MKSILCFLSVLVVLTSCKSYDPYQEADLINQEIEQKLDSLYNSETKSALLYKGLKKMKDYQDILIKEKKELFKAENLKIFSEEVTDIEKLEMFKKIKSKIQQEQRINYSKLNEKFYIKENGDYYSIFYLDKKVDWKEEGGTFTFHNRKGDLAFQIKNGLMYFENHDKPIFVEEVTDNSFCLVSEDLVQAKFVNPKNDLLGYFVPYKTDNGTCNFDIEYFKTDKVKIADKEYSVKIVGNEHTFMGVNIRNFKLYVDSLPIKDFDCLKQFFNDKDTMNLVFSLSNHNDDPASFSRLKLYRGWDLLYEWRREQKEKPENIVDFLK
ncbi:MAG: hypothetical protein ACLUVZ_10095 [Bacteroides stercoris]